MNDAVDAPELSLTIPCYNEEGLLRRTAERLGDEFAQRGIRVQFVLVDNGSADRTGEIIDEMIAEGFPATKAVVEQNQGYGYGVQVGFRHCRGRYVGIIPADGQVDPRDVVNLAEFALTSERPSLVKARRRFRMDGLRRKVVSTAYNGLINLLWFGLGSIDINGSPKMFPREYVVAMNLISKDWFLDAEIMIKARMLGLPVTEFNVMAQMRNAGQSNVGNETIAEFLRNLFRWRLRGIPARGAIKPETLTAPATVAREGSSVTG